MQPGGPSKATFSKGAEKPYRYHTTVETTNLRPGEKVPDANAPPSPGIAGAFRPLGAYDRSKAGKPFKPKTTEEWFGDAKGTSK